MLDWCSANCDDERKPGETEEQFLYKTRKKAIGPFKRRLWTIPEENAAKIGANLRAKFGLLFDELGIAGTRGTPSSGTSRGSPCRGLPASLGGDGRRPSPPARRSSRTTAPASSRR